MDPTLSLSHKNTVIEVNAVVLLRYCRDIRTTRTRAVNACSQDGMGGIQTSARSIIPRTPRSFFLNAPLDTAFATLQNSDRSAVRLSETFRSIRRLSGSKLHLSNDSDGDMRHYCEYRMPVGTLPGIAPPPVELRIVSMEGY